MADFWDSLSEFFVPNVAGETAAKVADTRAKYAGPSGRLDPNAITKDTLSSYGLEGDNLEDASAYLPSYRMNADLARSALEPPKRSWGDNLGALLQAAAIPVSYAQGNSGYGSMLARDNIMTRDADMREKLKGAGIDATLKNAQQLTGNIDASIAQRVAEQQEIRKAKRLQQQRAEQANAYGFKEGTPEYFKFMVEGKYDPTQGLTDDQKEYKAAVEQGFKGTIVDFLQMKKSTTGNPASYRSKPDGTSEFVPGGPADPATVSRLSEARGRGSQNVPVAVRTAGIQADQAYSQLTKALDDYADLVDGKVQPDGSASGGTGTVMWPGQDKDKVLAARRGIQLQLKELFNLGVLNGPDLALMDTMLFDPNVDYDPRTWSNAFHPGSRARASVKNLKDQLREIRNSKTRAIGLPDIGEDGKPVPGTGRVSTDTTAAGAAEVEGPTTPPDFSSMSDEDLLRELEGRGAQ